MAGWVKIHRKLKDHWLWQDAEKLKWWLDLLLEVNHESRKVLLKGSLIDCDRGQCVKSLDTWAKEWRTTKKTVRNFFLLLQKDGMVELESVTVSTRLTICKYESYQESGNAAGTASRQKNGEKLKSGSKTGTVSTRTSALETDSCEDNGHCLETQRKRSGNAAETQPTPKQECKELEKDKKEEDAQGNFSSRPDHAPSDEDVMEYFYQQGKIEIAEAFIKAHNANGWTDSDGKPIGKWRMWALGWIAKIQASAEREAKQAAKQTAAKPRVSTYVPTERDFNNKKEWEEYLASEAKKNQQAA